MTTPDYSEKGFPLQAWPIVWFFVRFMAIFVVLTVPWPGLPRAYAPLYRAGANAVFAHFGFDGMVEVRAVANGDPDRDTEFVLRNVRTQSKYVFAGTTLKGYQPTAYILALILATPIPWSRRWRAAFWGLALVTVYACTRLCVFLLFVFSGDNALALFSLGPVARHALDFVYWVVVESSAGWLLVPLPIWVFLCFRGSGWPVEPCSPPQRPNLPKNPQ